MVAEAMWWVGCGGYVVGGSSHLDNRATSWPNLQAEALQDFKYSCKPKLDPSVAKVDIFKVFAERAVEKCPRWNF